MSDHRVESAVHDAALILQKRARKLDADRSLCGFFCTTAYHELLRMIENDRDVEPVFNGQLDTVVANSTGSEPSEFARALEAYIATFPDLEREILALDIIHNFALSGEEVAKLVGTTRDTVYSLRRRTKLRLQSFLGGGPGQNGHPGGEQ